VIRETSSSRGNSSLQMISGLCCRAAATARAVMLRRSERRGAPPLRCRSSGTEARAAAVRGPERPPRTKLATVTRTVFLKQARDKCFDDLAQLSFNGGAVEIVAEFGICAAHCGDEPTPASPQAERADVLLKASARAAGTDGVGGRR